LMCAFDLPSPEIRDKVKKLLYDRGILVLACGPRGIRFRPPLTISSEEINEGLSVIEDVIKGL